MTKLVCIFDYEVNEHNNDSSDSEAKTPNGRVNQELVKSVVYGESRILDKKIQAAKQEISLLKVKERDLR